MGGIRGPLTTQAECPARSAQPRCHATPRKQEASGLTEKLYLLAAASLHEQQGTALLFFLLAASHWSSQLLGRYTSPSIHSWASS